MHFSIYLNRYRCRLVRVPVRVRVGVLVCVRVGVRARMDK